MDKVEIAVRVAVAVDAIFKESEHPRNKEGKFTEGADAGVTTARLTPTEKSFVSYYTGDGFSRINRELRMGIQPDAHVMMLDKAISKSKLASGMKLYRGMSREDARKLFGGSDINTGDVISDKAFVSTSRNRDFVLSFYSTGGVMLEIEVGDNQNGLDTAGLTRNPQEQEVLLPRNTKMQVSSIQAPKKLGVPVVVKVKTVKSAAAIDSVEVAVRRAVDTVLGEVV